ncbi:MAG: HNH endonuclease [Clostridia bacterium]|jgi:hypothetical protein|nr:HNH endonuclease [Clostridia bacterium]
MSIKNKINIDKHLIEEAISVTPTMGAAAKYLKIDWRTFKKIATEYCLYAPVVGDQHSRCKFELNDILNGLHPQYPTIKLSKRLVAEGYLLYKCNSCGIIEYNGKNITLELNHIDGDNSNHTLSNLELLCPNCHSQTDTYRSKNKNKK